MIDLEGKTAVVTGASSGIGKATSYRLAEEGMSVVLASRNKAELRNIAEDIQQRYSTEALAVKTDVTSEKDVKDLFRAAKEEYKQIDIVVSNAGLAMTGEVEDMPTEHYRRNNEVNIDGMFHVARESISYLKDTEGNLIFMGSIAGKYPRGTNPVYAASKAWTINFAKSLSAQIGGEGVAVTVVNPSEVRTEFNAETGTSFAEAFEEGDVTEPEQIADGVVFAAKQDKNNTVEELNLYRRDKLSDMELG